MSVKAGQGHSWIRFEAGAPNEVWQSDFTHWRLADETEVELINWLDDHSRYLLACEAFRRVAGDDVVATFTATGDAHGWPAATITDNGAVYTSRFTGGRNGFEYLLAWLGVRQKNGSPGHPQTQGKDVHPCQAAASARSELNSVPVRSIAHSTRSFVRARAMIAWWCDLPSARLRS